MEAMEGFYTAKEAREKLGVTDDRFQYMVRTGQVHKVIPPGRKYGVYAKVEIDTLVGQHNQFVRSQKREHQKTIFRAARPEDAQAMFEFGQSIMERSGGYGLPPEFLQSFLSVPHSEIGHVLYRDGQLIGYFTIVPLKHEALMQVMTRKIRIRNVKPEQLAQFEPGEPIDCYIWEVITDPDEKQTAAYIIKKMLVFFHTIGKRGVEINGLYASATSREGIDICRKMGMHEMDLPEVTQPNWIPFELKLQETRNRFTRNYIQALKSYRKRLSEQNN